MGYFRELPEVDYQSFLSDSNSSQNYLRVKNLFRRNKLRDDLQSSFTLFNKYEIVEGCLLYTSPSPRDLSTSRMPSSA